MSHIRNILAVSLRESRRILSSPLYIFSLVGAPLLCFVFFLTLMGKGLPSGLPVGVGRHGPLGPVAQRGA